MKKLILISALLLVATNGWAYSEADLAKLKALNDCGGCDLGVANLTGADLDEANLRGANLTDANLNGVDFTGVDLCYANLTTNNLKYAKLAGAKFCRT